MPFGNLPPDLIRCIFEFIDDNISHLILVSPQFHEIIKCFFIFKLKKKHQKTFMIMKVFVILFMIQNINY